MAETTLPKVTISEQFGTRYLHLGTPWVQGAMQIRRPDKLVLEYVQRMMAWLLFVHPQRWQRGHAAQLGLGAASLTKYCLRRLRLATTAVELNPEVIVAAHAWFDLPLPGRVDGVRLAVEQADAGDWVAQAARRGRLCALMVDLYDHEAQAPVLDSPRFYADCRAALVPGGAASINLFGGRADFRRSLAHIAAAFEQVWRFEPTAEGNVVVLGIASHEVPDAALLRLRAASVAQNTDLPARKWPRRLQCVKG
jgi:spermidine synthase